MLFDAYAILVPSGEKEGKVSVLGFLVSRLTLVPSRSKTSTSEFPSREDMKTMCSPLGDHCACSLIPMRSGKSLPNDGGDTKRKKSTVLFPSLSRTSRRFGPSPLSQPGGRSSARLATHDELESNRQGA